MSSDTGTSCGWTRGAGGGLLSWPPGSSGGRARGAPPSRAPAAASVDSSPSSPANGLLHRGPNSMAP
eukprot:11160443-Lingulodinium_polyedra.AAC.1